MSFPTLSKLLAGLSLFACASAFAAPLTVDVTGAQSWGLYGDTRNTVFDNDVGANAAITSLSYTVNLTAFNPSFLSEMRLAIVDSGGIGIVLTPGTGFATPGTRTFTGTYDLTALGANFNVGADGILHLEFFEAFDDPSVAPDGIWNVGTVTLGVEDAAGAVPEPSTLLLMGVGLALAGSARRRRA